MIYEEIVDGFVARRFTCSAGGGAGRAWYRRGLKNGLQHDRRELRDSRQELKGDPDELESDRREYRQDRPIRSQERRTRSGQGGNPGFVRQFTRQSPGG